jgi:AcrR family transcriptional regulator
VDHVSVGTDVSLGLRERKKRETRDALSWAVIRLSVERGWHAVRVEDVAAAAGVSERTFRNYFSGKADALASRHLDRMLRAAEQLRTRPAAQPLWEAVADAVAGQFSAEQPQGREWAEAVRLMLTEPEVEAGFLRANAVAQRALAAAVAERTGTDAARELYPVLAAAAIVAASSAAVEHWLRAHPPLAINVLIREAVGRVSAGLPMPTA